MKVGKHPQGCLLLYRVHITCRSWSVSSLFHFSGATAIRIIFAVLGKFCINASFSTIYVFSSELLPTVIRCVLVWYRNNHCQASMLHPMRRQSYLFDSKSKLVGLQYIISRSTELQQILSRRKLTVVDQCRGGAPSFFLDQSWGPQGRSAKKTRKDQTFFRVAPSLFVGVDPPQKNNPRKSTIVSEGF